MREAEALEKAAKLAVSSQDDSLPYIENAQHVLGERAAQAKIFNPTDDVSNDGILRTSSDHTSPRAANDKMQFYQATNGQMIFMHPLCVQMMYGEYGDYNKFPNNISGQIIDIEDISQTEKTRRKYKFLSHLPITCNFKLVDIDMSALVSPHVMEQFAGELQKQAQRRKKKQQLEQQRLKYKLREEKLQHEQEAQRTAERQAHLDMLAMRTSDFSYINDDDVYFTSDSDASSYTPPLSTTPVSSTPPQPTNIPRVTSVQPPKPSWANLVTGTPSDPFFQTPIYASPTAPSTSSSAKPSFADALKIKNDYNSIVYNNNNNVNNSNSNSNSNNNNANNTANNNTNNTNNNTNNTKGKGKKKQVMLLSNTSSRGTH
jgi:hypothetical protein